MKKRSSIWRKALNIFLQYILFCVMSVINFFGVFCLYHVRESNLGWRGFVSGWICITITIGWVIMCIVDRSHTDNVAPPQEHRHLRGPIFKAGRWYTVGDNVLPPEYQYVQYTTPDSFSDIAYYTAHKGWLGIDKNPVFLPHGTMWRVIYPTEGVSWDEIHKYIIHHPICVEEDVKCTH